MKICQECSEVLCECGNCHNYDGCPIAVDDCLLEVCEACSNSFTPADGAEDCPYCHPVN